MKVHRFVLLAVLVSIVAGCAPDTGLDKPSAIIMISIDTLRSDRLPIYGYDKVDTPAIDALRADGILYERAYTHYPLTLPAHVSLFTGELPPDHGVRDNLGYTVDPDAPTLAGMLGETGWATGGFVSAFVLRGESGVSMGFDIWDDELPRRLDAALGESQRAGIETTRRAIAWLETQAASTDPFFLFVHLYEPHTPYTPPKPFDRYEHPYDGEIATADAAVGVLLDRLRELDRYDDALIVLLSDHGEGLGDHGEQEHGILLYREALQVPLVVKLPGGARAGDRVDEPSQLIDVLPTVLEMVSLPEPFPLDGTSLLALGGDRDPGERDLYAETFYPRLHLGWSDLASIIRGRHHLIDGPAPELYDLIDDPAETRDLVSSDRRTFATLREAVSGYDRTLASPSAVDEEAKARLAALGYLSGGAVAEGPLPDPKSQLHLLDDLGAANRAFGEQDWARATELFAGLVEASPQMSEAWNRLAVSYQRQGRIDDADAAFRQALETSGGSPTIALDAARFFLQQGRVDDAVQHAELALQTMPEGAHTVLAQIALSEGDLATAETEADAALEVADDSLQAWVTKAQIERTRGDLDTAWKHAERASELYTASGMETPPPGFHFVRGDILARRGNTGDAGREFLLEIEHYPLDPPAYTGLSLLYAVEGRGAEAVAVLRQMVGQIPQPRGYVAAVETLSILGDTTSARALLDHALSRFPDSATLQSLQEQIGG
ncbi:MAG: sulfatase-like hydrolase/transferase [Acidobacteriota bacterium]